MPHGNDEMGLLARSLDESAAAVADREQRLTEQGALLDNANDAIIVRDMEHRITYWNRAAERLYGWSAAEAHGRRLQQLLLVDMAVFQASERALHDTGHWKGEIQKTAKGGAAMTVQGSWTLLRDAQGKPASILTIDTDITARKVAEATIRASEERLRELAETIQEVFWIADPVHDRMLYVSPAYEEIWGRSCASLYESAGGWPDAVHPDDRARVAQAVRTNREHGKYVEHYRIVRTDGTVRWIHDRAFPVHDAAGAIVRIVGAAEDVTDRRKVEEQLRQAQKMEAIGHLTGGLAHDFNNLLGVIIGNLDLAKPLVATNDEAAANWWTTSLEAALSGAELTRRLLAFARQQPLQPACSRLNALVEGMVKLLARTLGEDIEIALDLGRGSVAGAGGRGPAGIRAGQSRDQRPRRDAERRPAADRHGNRHLDADYAAAHAEVVPGDYVMIEVSDTGTGMTPEILEHVFEPFYTTKEPGKGTGLGLSMVFGFIKQSAGHINVYSEAGVGTTFRLYLPRADATATALEAAQPVRSPTGGSETILVVEDNAALRRMAVRQIQTLGYRVLEADSPRSRARLSGGRAGRPAVHGRRHARRDGWVRLGTAGSGAMADAQGGPDLRVSRPQAERHRREVRCAAVEQTISCPRAGAVAA